MKTKNNRPPKTDEQNLINSIRCDWTWKCRYAKWLERLYSRQQQQNERVKHDTKREKIENKSDIDNFASKKMTILHFSINLTVCQKASVCISNWIESNFGRMLSFSLSFHCICSCTVQLVRVDICVWRALKISIYFFMFMFACSFHLISRLNRKSTLSLDAKTYFELCYSLSLSHLSAYTFRMVVFTQT